MPIIVVGTEKNFAALRPRLFAGGKISNKDAGAVADAVREANPHANLDKLTPGTVLTVPDSPKVRVRGDLSVDEPTAKGLEALAEHGKSALAGVADAAARREADDRKARAQVLKALDAIGSGTRRPREGPPAKDLAAARKAIEEEDGRAKERANVLKRAQAEWTAGLDALKQRAG